MSGLLRVAFVVLPVVAISYEAGSYLVECFHTLTAPGVPVDFRVKTKSGPIRAWAQSYAYDWARGTLFINHPKVQTPKGDPLGQADSVRIVGLDPRHWRDPVVRATVRNLSARIVRLPNGRFELEQFLPSNPPTVGGVPFEIEVQSGRAALIDLTGKRPWRLDASTPYAVVAGRGASWVSRGTVMLAGVGTTVATLQNLPDVGLHIDGSTVGLRLEGILPKLAATDIGRRTPELAKLSATKLIAQGPFSIFLPPKQVFQVESRANLVGVGVNYQQYHLDRVAFDGILRTRSLEGKVYASLGGSHAEWQGAAEYVKGVRASGHLDAAVSNDRELPPWVRRDLPPGLGFRGAQFHGWVSSEHAKPFRANGAFQAAAIQYRQDTVTDARGEAFATVGELGIRLDTARYGGVTALGMAVLDLKTKSVQAIGRATGGNLAVLGSRFRVPGLAGTLGAEASVSGPISHPQGEVFAQGRLAFTRDGKRFDFGNYDLAGHLQGRKLVVDRGVAKGPMGRYVAEGSLANQIQMKVTARDAPVGVLIPGAGGFVNAVLNLTGTPSDPRAAGRAEGYRLSYQNQVLPAATADFHADRRMARVDRFEAIQGTAQASGAGSIRFAGSQVEGHMQALNLQINDVLGAEFAGVLSASKVTVSGTLNRPTVEAVIEGHNLVASGVKIDRVSANAQLVGSIAKVDQGRVDFDAGTLIGTASYDLKAKRGTADASADNLSLARLIPDFTEIVDIDGIANVRNIHADFSAHRIAATASGSLDKLKVNGAAAGDGNWSASSDGKTIEAKLSVGQLIPDLRVLDASAVYNLKTQDLTADLLTRNVRIGELLGATQRYLAGAISGHTTNLKDILEQAHEFAYESASPSPLQGLAGDLTLAAHASGTLKNLDVAVTDLEAANLSYTQPLDPTQQHQFGTLKASRVERRGQAWSVAGLALDGPAGTLRGEANSTEDGKLTGSADLRDLKLAAFSPWAPALNNNRGTFDLNLQAAGRVDNPQFNGKADLKHFGRIGAPADRELNVSISSIQGSRDQGVAAAGRFDYSGFQGALSGHAAIVADADTGRRPISGTVALDPRDLDQIDLIRPYLDRARTKGNVSGQLTVAGSLERPTASGTVDFAADRLALLVPSPNPFIKRIDDSLTQLTAKLSLDPQGQVHTRFGGTSDRGGTVALDVTTGPQDMAALLAEPSRLFDALLAGTVNGDLTLNKFAFRQAITGGFVAGVINGTVPLSGTLKAPNLGTADAPGSFTMANLDTVLPTIPPSSTSTEVSLIQPTFNLVGALSTPARVRSSTADITLTGDGSLTGTLSDPLGLANLVVQRGSIQLPGSVVRIDPGGTIDFAFRRTFADLPSAALNVDMQGRTALTTSRFGEGIRRYDILLDIRGDLLKDQGLQLTAYSDPPDLTTNEALAMLGQQQFIESVGSSGSQLETEKRLRDAFAGFALPSLLNPVTSGIAKTFGLDYLSVDYNPLEGTTFSFSRPFGTELAFQVRRQIGGALPGMRAIYDYRLVYSPRRLGPKFRRFSFSFGTDQDRPWKAAVEYGSRFGSVSRPDDPVKRTILSGPGVSGK